MTVIKGIDHFLGIFRIVHKLLIEIFPHSHHVQVVVLHEIQFAEYALAKASPPNSPICGDVHQCLLVFVGQLKVHFLGTALYDVIVSFGMLAAVVNVLLIDGLRVVTVDLNAAGELEI